MCKIYFWPGVRFKVFKVGAPGGEHTEKNVAVDFMTKLQLPNLHQTIINMFLTINISYSNNPNKF